MKLAHGDTLSKLALRYNLDAATIKTANGLIGNEIECWRDELWLPPLQGQQPRPAEQVDPLCQFRSELHTMRRRQLHGTQVMELPSRLEAQAYLSLHNNDMMSAVCAFEEDAIWAFEQSK